MPKIISGVVEGFYGKPWTPSQRLELFKRLEYMGLNTYLYAPKDDMKHRQLWRDLYSKDETIQLKYLIDSSKKYNITFVYAISPGIDITFSNNNDTVLLKQKMQQVLDLGCEAFSLLFDDICPTLRDIDKDCFQSLASAQATLTNDIYEYLKKPHFFLFCPTEYCASRAVPNVLKSEYLSTIGEVLKADIDVMWTGPKVISKFITVDSIVELSSVLKRQPVIWDNIHANDYDQKRLFLGPYCGRSSKLIPYIRGILTNPNCEFEANFVAIHTLAQWAKSNGDENNPGMGYIPSVGLRLALIDWLEVLYQKKELINEYLTSISLTSATEAVSPTTVTLSPNNLDAIANITQMFSPDFLQTGQNSQSHTNTVLEVVSVTSPLLLSPVSKEASPNDQLISNQHDKTSPLSVVSHLPGTDVKDSDGSNSNGNPSSNYDNKNCFITYSTSYEVGDKTVEKLPKSEDVLTTNEVVNDMETMDNNILNVFPLTPMETEDNASDVENVHDPMAMQVDSAEEGHCETMDVIDEANNGKLYSEKVKQSASSNAEESEMEDTTSNESIDLNTDVTVSNKLTVDDLNLLVHIFFLPYEHGPLAIKMLELIYWIRSHACQVTNKHKQSSELQALSRVIDGQSDIKSDDSKSVEWHTKAKEFEDQVESIRNVVDRMCNIPNRSVLFDLYPYIQELRHVLDTLNSYVKWIGGTSKYKDLFMNDEHEPWMFRGGVISEFQRMFPLEGSHDVFPNRTSFLQYPPRCGSSLFDTDADGEVESGDSKLPITDVHITNNIGIECFQSSIFIMRPYLPSDKPILYHLCSERFFKHLAKNTDVDQDHLNTLKMPIFKDLVGDRYIGVLLEYSPQSCMVLENENCNILGYAFGSTRVNEILLFRRDLYAEKMKIKYESKINILSKDDLTDSKPPSLVKSLMEGFYDETSLQYFREIIDKPQALVCFDVMDCCKQTDMDTVDTLCRRLLKWLCLTLKSNVDQAVIIGDCETCIDKSELLTHDSNDRLTDVSTSDCASKSRCVHLPMVLYCEVDSLYHGYEDFYRRCGFIKCDIGDNLGSVSLMSRYV